MVDLSIVNLANIDLAKIDLSSSSSHEEPENKYTIIASAGDGGTISNVGTTIVTEGSSMTYTITPNSGYNISNILVDGKEVTINNTYVFNNITSNHTIAANFKLAVPKFTITSSITQNSYSTYGNVSPLGATTINQGENVSYIISVNSGYIIKDVLIDNVSAGSMNSYTFTNVTSNHTIEVTIDLEDTNTYLKYIKYINGNVAAGDKYDTGIVPTLDTIITLQIAPAANANASSGDLLGERTSGTDVNGLYIYCNWYPGSNSCKFMFGSTNYTINTNSLVRDTTWTLTLTNTSCSITDGTTTLTGTLSTTSFTSTRSIYLMAFNTTETTRTPKYAGNIISLTITKSGNTYEFVPVLHNNVTSLYEKNNKTYHDNLNGTDSTNITYELK